MIERSVYTKITPNNGVEVDAEIVAIRSTLFQQTANLLNIASRSDPQGQERAIVFTTIFLEAVKRTISEIEVPDNFPIISIEESPTPLPETALQLPETVTPQTEPTELPPQVEIKAPIEAPAVVTSETVVFQQSEEIPMKYLTIREIGSEYGISLSHMSSIQSDATRGGIATTKKGKLLAYPEVFARERAQYYADREAAQRDPHPEKWASIREIAETFQLTEGSLRWRVNQAVELGTITPNMPGIRNVKYDRTILENIAEQIVAEKRSTEELIASGTVETCGQFAEAFTLDPDKLKLALRKHNVRERGKNGPTLLYSKEEMERVRREEGQSLHLNSSDSKKKSLR